MRWSIKNILLSIWLGVAAIRAVYFYFTIDIPGGYTPYWWGRMFGYAISWPIRWIFS